MTYKCLGGGRYLVTMYVYRDCRPQENAAALDSDASIAIYRGDSRYSLVGSFMTPLRSRDYINPPDYPCVELPPGLCVERGKYEFEINIPAWPSTQTYTIVYQRCCRNNTISNIVDPGSIGATFYTQISPESQAECNNSPVFKNFPPTVVCVGQAFVFDHSVTDTEADSISYKFGTPLEGGGMEGSSQNNPGNAAGCNGVKPTPPCPPPFRQATFKSPLYSTNNPMGGDPIVSIDPQTGVITGTPTVQGQFVISVIAEEFRAGVKIGEIIRDFQFNVAKCDPTVVAQVKSAITIDESSVFLRSCGEFTIPFRDSSYEERFIKTWAWKFDINGNEEVYNSKDVDVTFPALGNYTGQLIVNEGTECSDSTDIVISVLPNIEASFDFFYDTCVAGDVTFNNFSFSDADGGITSYQWDFGDGSQSTLKDVKHLFQSPGLKEVSLLVTDKNQCMATMVQTLSYYPIPPLDAFPMNTEIACLPAGVVFDNLPPPINGEYDISWDFGDGEMGTGYQPYHIYEGQGVYDVGVDIISPIGCSTSVFFPRMVVTQPSPIADFDYSPLKPTNLDKEVTFVNQSTDAVSYVWDIPNVGSYTDENIVINFPDSGIYLVALTAIHENGCMDTAFRPVDIEPIVIYTVPNAFSPNNDLTNDEFKGLGVFVGMKDFRIRIYDRWGSQVFTSNDPQEGWDGSMGSQNRAALPGTYVYVVEYLDARNRPKTFFGEVFLIN
ncbi:hypothetical protein GCM10025777_09660 [Membranihabitans marinus]